MQNLKLGTVVRFLPLGLVLSVVVAACGGTSTSDGDKNTGGSATATGGTTGASTGGTTSTSTGKAGSTGTTTGKAGSTSTGTGGSTSTGTGGSTGSSGGDFMSGLPEDKPISSLTDAEVMQLCSAVQTYFSDSVKDLSCRVSGLLAAALMQAKTDAEAQAACKSAYDMCAAQPATSTTGNCMKPTGMCTATVGELEACASDDKAVFAQLDSEFPSCDKLKLQDLAGLGNNATQPMEPASCVALDMKCPGTSMPAMGMMTP